MDGLRIKALLLVALMQLLLGWPMMLALGIAGLAVGYWPSVLLTYVVFFVGHSSVTIHSD